MRKKRIRNQPRNPSEYCIYHEMKARCYNPNHPGYHNYGGRGIKVCKRWLKGYKYFLQDMGLRPSLEHSLERVRNNGHYSKNNCKWATRKEQSRNKRVNRILKHNGLKMCVADWSEKLGIKRSSIINRLERGWSVADALSPLRLQTGKRREVIRMCNNVNNNVIYRSLTEAAKENGTSIQNIANCLRGKSKTCVGFKWQYKQTQPS